MTSSGARSRSLLLVAGLGLSLALTGCGSSSDKSGDGSGAKASSDAFAKKSGKEIFSAAKTAMKQTGAMHLTGNMIDGGARLTIDAKSDGKGGCAGQFGSKGATATFVATSDATYLKANDQFWIENGGGQAAAEQTIKYLDGRWAKLPASDKFSALCGLGNQLFDSAGASDAGNVVVGKVSTINGHPVVELSSGLGKEQYRLYVRTDEPHQLLKIVSDTKGDTGEMNFDFDENVSIDVPAATESVAIG